MMLQEGYVYCVMYFPNGHEFCHLVIHVLLKYPCHISLSCFLYHELPDTIIITLLYPCGTRVKFYHTQHTMNDTGRPHIDFHWNLNSYLIISLRDITAVFS